MLGLGYLAQDFLGCNWRFFWGLVPFKAVASVERTIGDVVITTHPKDTEGGVGHVWGRGEDEGVSCTGHDRVALVVRWSLFGELVAEGLGSVHILGIIEEGSLHEVAAYDVVV